MKSYEVFMYTSFRFMYMYVLLISFKVKYYIQDFLFIHLYINHISSYEF